ncbi:mechanosensitive ion channel family protein [Lacticaseibacillus mingshuiensis]|uniref:Mechanosensitive ion channel family protein n=1 Tax=Lacticaseibacillus mingshuiensis TaxID=2799574 RepID=A0ABW4CHB0_9LACO|nr:mechanosensitive ion channel family protein [Lacticaseibacillus mingshuiensis]
MKKVVSGNVLTRYFDKIDWDAMLDHALLIIGELIFFSLLFWLIERVGKAVIARGFKAYQAKATNASTRVDTIRVLSINALSYIVLFFYCYAILSVLGIPVGTLLAGAGIVGIALGLGAQGFVADVVTGFFIILEGQFDVGDQVTLGAISGTVSSVGLRTTIVQSADGTINYIPNRNISVVSNLSRNQMLVLIQLPLAPDTDLKKVGEVVAAVNEKLVKDTPTVTDGPDVLGLTTSPHGGLVYQVRMHAQNGEQLNVQRKFLAAYVQALAEAGITLATPPLTLR